ncbi:2-amino-4-hydroxy-6-hydroxymethyldihydropteridine diphosphokinase [Erythrobacter insulae]|uniref:2-amino-4-hydroxy-6-hydroxymethyldihydropteridine pyrophosphokinase n=1 Tax=Erythrobacter insulae TaxID=2584124 RepID=A0A547PA26_9SPHN|nr:2-amino-4-hydroxy-6-hydroxymethyldihydropteridine diphosphokinase [Erythrobacter insulae]TRD10995.1 2-amino-4-hydroxy-6-hydroxymethyldihydropteridine diphosphokinase [Erythrobacter insulae]
MSSRYLIALGSNRRHHAYGRPRDVVRAAMEELSALGTVLKRSEIFRTPPMGAAQRRFANAAAVLESEYDPMALLAAAKRMEREFGRRRGRRWGDRVLDVDIVLWSGGVWSGSALEIPHQDYRHRDFVLIPANRIAADWRDPIGGLSIRQLAARI